MKVLGIDQSYNSSGLVILENDNIIHAECFKSDKTKNRFGQAHEITARIIKIIKEYKPKLIAIEGLAFGLKGNMTRDLGGLQFVIISHLQEVMKYDVKIIAPLTVKKYATGNGRAQKIEMIESLPKDILNNFESLGVKKTTGLADLADAYWIANTAIEKYK